MTWTLSTWSSRVARSAIEKKGLEGDKAKLGDATYRNKSRPVGAKRKGRQSKNPRDLIRQQKRQATQQQRPAGVTTVTVAATRRASTTNASTNTGMAHGAAQAAAATTINEGTHRIGTARRPTRTSGQAPTFDQAFDHVLPPEQLDLDPVVQQRYQKTLREGRVEVEGLLAAQRNRRARAGDAVGDGGDLMWVNPHGRDAIQQNRGDLSTVSRQQASANLANTATTAAAPGTNEGTPCPIPDCKMRHLVPDHPCYNSTICKKRVHNMCAQANGFCDKDNELNMYCSRKCKDQKEQWQKQLR